MRITIMTSMSMAFHPRHLIWHRIVLLATLSGLGFDGIVTRLGYKFGGRMHGVLGIYTVFFCLF